MDEEKPAPCHSEAERGGGICLNHAASCILRTLGQNRTFSFLIKKDGAAILTLDVPYTTEEMEARMR